MPWPADSMSVVGPVTKSPLENTPRTLVAYVPGSTRTRPRLISNEASTGRNVLSAAWLTAGMTVSALTVNSVPGTGTGARRPVASGSPRRLRIMRTPTTLPSSSPSTSMGLVRNSMCTPSRSVSPSSSWSTTSSERVRRYEMVTFLAPWRRLVRAQSMAV